MKHLRCFNSRSCDDGLVPNVSLDVRILDDAELSERIARTWTCSCGHTETHDQPAALRKLAQRHAKIHEVTR